MQHLYTHKQGNALSIVNSLHFPKLKIEEFKLNYLRENSVVK